jgi:cell division protein FtsI (penicillin-binding protein 3)
MWLLGAAVLFGRAVEVQVVQGATWRAQADRQHRMSGEVAAARGAILDRSGVALAVSHEAFRVGVAPHELEDRERAAELLAVSLGIPASQARAVTQDRRRWVQVPGRFPPTVREAVRGMRGVYVEREVNRFYPQGALARGLLGVVVDQVGMGGVEEQFEEHLRGIPGAETLARDSGGRLIPGETWIVTPPRMGGSLVLTLDVGLQEIAHEALERAVDENEARGGDLLVTDPRTGEILAMVSIRDGSANHLGVLNTPYEPGSTLKPFTVATLLREDRVALEDSVDTGNGSWVVHGRQITDVSAVGKVTVAHALQASSNVGIAKAASALDRDEQFEGLRDFGFGVPTGVRLPGEAGGTLRRPSAWSLQSPASLAIGYEIAVTPIQVAMAYGALANGGVLMEPRLVREIRDDRGRVVERFEPRVVRRVVSEEVAGQINRALVEAVEVGTGTRARLASFAVAGKSGTSRAYGESGYDVGDYFASFVGFFPAEDPQLVVFVKLERPRGAAYYGGATAAPVTRATLEAILAARNPPLDREALAAIARAQRSVVAPTAVVGAGPPGPLFAAARVEVEVDPPLAESSVTKVAAEVEDARIAVPDLRGLSPRAAARRLHFMGLHVISEAGGAVTGTRPEAGTLVPPGGEVRLVTSSRGAGRRVRTGAAGDG